MTATAATCLIIVLTLCLSGFVSSSTWQYGDEDHWPNECKEGKNQSPIPLSRSIAKETDFVSLIFENYGEVYPVISKNNGHSAEIRIHVQEAARVKGGGLPEEYIFDHFHFHWQSEHTVDSYRYPLELHLVHYANKYKGLGEALKHTNGVAVLAVLFDLSPDDDKEFEPLVNVISKLQDKVNENFQMHLRIEDYLPRDRAGFYRYNGSLTTPNCTEGIIWTVFTNTIPISQNQVKTFQGMKTEKHTALDKNYRSLQDVNDREIFLRVSPIRTSNKNEKCTGSSASSLSFKFYVILLLLTYLLSM